MYVDNPEPCCTWTTLTLNPDVRGLVPVGEWLPDAGCAPVLCDATFTRATHSHHGAGGQIFVGEWLPAADRAPVLCGAAEGARHADERGVAQDDTGAAPKWLLCWSGLVRGSMCARKAVLEARGRQANNSTL
eukprot:125010-Chlamydomonas_euryale.AAC.3